MFGTHPTSRYHRRAEHSVANWTNNSTHTHTYTRMHVHSQHGADITVFKCLSHDSRMHSWPAYIIKSDHIERKQPNIEM